MKKKLVSLFLTLCLIVTLLPVQALAAAATVTTESDLRTAVAVDGFSVTLDDDITLTSDLEITASGTIDGCGHILSGGTITTPDWLDATVELAIRNLTITNAGGRGVYIGWSGMDEEKFLVTMTNCTVTGCTAPKDGQGGGIFNGGTLTMEDCIVTNCATTEYGGGGGIFNGGTLTMTGCSLLNNNASTASAIESFGHEPESEAYLYLTDCVISGNTARIGASMRIDCGGVLESCVITGNIGTDPVLGGGIYHSGGMHSSYANGSLALNNCVVAGNYVIADNTSTQSDMIGEEPELLTAVNSVVGVTMPSQTGKPMEFGFILSSSVNEAPAVNAIFADVEIKSVNGVEITVPTANSEGKFDLTGTYAGMVSQPIPTFTKVETTRTSFTWDDYVNDMSRAIRVLSNVPCTSYFSWESLNGSNYTEKGTTRARDLYLEGHAEETGEKGPDFPVYYYIDREGYDPVVGHVVVSIEKLEQEAPNTENMSLHGDSSARYLYSWNGPALDFSFDGGLTWKHFPDLDDWHWYESGKNYLVLSDEDFNTISPQYGIMTRWSETLYEYPSEPAVISVTRQEQPNVTVTQESAVDDTAMIFGLTNMMESSTDGTNWTMCPQNAPAPTLTQGETLYVRTRGGAPNLLPSLPLVLTAERVGAEQEATPAAQINFQRETITNLDADADYFVNGSPFTASGTGTISIPESWLGTDISVVKRGGDSTNNSDAQTLTVPARPAAPSVTGQAETYPGAGDGILSFAEASLEYREVGETNWIAYSADIKLAAGNYQARIPAAADTFASMPAFAVIGTTLPTVEETPAATLQGDNLSGLVPGADYDVSGTVCTASEAGTIAAQNDWRGTVISIIKKGNGTTTKDSVVQSLSIPAKGICTVTFDAQGGSNVPSQTVTIGNKATKPSDPILTGYNFDGWYTEADCTTAWGFDTLVTGNMTLYAKWTKKPNPVMPGPVTPDPDDTPAPPVWENPFTDVQESDWYYAAVEFANENGLFYGTSDTTFSPNGDMTRGMLATVFYRLAKEPETAAEDLFSDVADDKYYTEAVAWAAENGIVAGYGNGKYGPEDPITREQLAAILWRYDGSPENAGSLDSFTDGAKTSDWAVPALQWAVKQKIVSGKGNGILDPRGKATRAEVAAMLMRYCKKVESR